MTGLLLKDALLIKSSFSPAYLGLVALSLFVGISNPSAIPVFFGTMMSFVLVFQAVLTIDLDITAGWERSEAAMPIAIIDGIAEKYLLSLIAVVCAVALTLAFEAVFIFFGLVQANTAFLTGMMAFASGTVYFSVIIPSIYKFGILKSRMVFIAFIAFLTAAPMILRLGGVDVFSLASGLNTGAWTVVLFLVLMAIIICSLLTSIKIKKERRLTPDS